MFVDWELFVTNNTDMWRDTNLLWIKNSTEAIVVHYENLKENIPRELGRVKDYLNMEIANYDERMKCLLKTPQGYFKRKARPSLVR